MKVGPAPIQMDILRFTSCMSVQTDAFCRAAAGPMAQALGVRVEFVEHSSWEQRLEELTGGAIHMAWVCGLPYSRWADEDPGRLETLAAPVMAGNRYAGRPVYYSDVVVRRASPHAAFEDLRGAAWTYNEAGSFSGHVVVCAHLAARGEGRSFFGRWVASGSHLRSLEMVLDGRAEAAAIDSTVLDMAAADDLGLPERIRSLQALGPHPAPPWVISRSLPRRVREKARAWFSSLHQSPGGRALLDRFRIDCFAEVQDRDYDSIRVTSRMAGQLAS